MRVPLCVCVCMRLEYGQDFAFYKYFYYYCYYYYHAKYDTCVGVSLLQEASLYCQMGGVHQPEVAGTAKVVRLVVKRCHVRVTVDGGCR